MCLCVVHSASGGALKLRNLLHPLVPLHVSCAHVRGVCVCVFVYSCVCVC